MACHNNQINNKIKQSRYLGFKNKNIKQKQHTHTHTQNYGRKKIIIHNFVLSFLKRCSHLVFFFESWKRDML